MAEETITLSSDDNSDSETSEQNSDNEETPLKKKHVGTWTSKKEVLETIKSYISSVAMKTMNIYTYCFQYGYMYSNLKNW